MEWELYKLNEKIGDFFSREDLDSLTEEQFDDAIKLLGLETDYVLSNLCAVVKTLEGYAETVKQEIKHLEDKKDSYESKAEKVKASLGRFLGAGGKWTNGVHSLSWRKSEQVQPAANNADGCIPGEYTRIKEVVEADKKAMKEDLKAGKEVSGWQIVTKQSLQVK